MRRLAFAFATLLAGVGAPAAVAQDDTVTIPSPILTIDQDRLLSETRSGAALSKDVEDRAAALSEENARIEADLIERERSLTEQRPSLTPEEFRALADAFNDDVSRIRAEQDEKARAVARAQEEAQQQFLSQAAGIISDIVREEGALIVLDRRDVFLSADRIDITDEAIARINAVFNASPPE